LDRRGRLGALSRRRRLPESFGAPSFPARTGRGDGDGGM